MFAKIYFTHIFLSGKIYLSHFSQRKVVYFTYIFFSMRDHTKNCHKIFSVYIVNNGNVIFLS